jgi:MerR family mercuric resistance operon transcriptional regulator
VTQKSFTIGALAKKAGVNIETIRFYQRRSLLVEPIKPFKGVRHYSERDVQRVRFIKQGQKIGFSLDEILELLSLEDGQHCREAKEIALRKLILIRERIENLRTMETALSNLVENCTNNTESVSCPIILTLMKTSA